MTWFKIDDSFYDHPKVLGLDFSAVGLWVLAGAYCARHLTDGEISDRQIRAIGGTRRQAQKLVAAGLWSVHRDDVDAPPSDRRFVFNDWLDFQPTRQTVLDQRAADAARKAAARAAKQVKRKNVRPDVQPDNTPDVRLDVRPESGEMSTPVSALPGPTRPGPTSTTYVGSAADGNVPSARGNADTFSDGTPIPADPGPEPATHGANALAPVVAPVVALHPPAAVETGTRPKPPEPTQAARAVVRQVIPGLTRQVIDQLAVHLTKAARDDVPDAAIRAGLERWRDDPGKPNPGALPYRIGDAARELAAQPAARPPSTSDRKFAAAQALKRPEWGDPTDHQELEP